MAPQKTKQKHIRVRGRLQEDTKDVTRERMLHGLEGARFPMDEDIEESNK